MTGGTGLVNFKYSPIFNGIFETYNSTKNEKRFAKMCAKDTWASRVYHDSVKHDERLCEIDGLLSRRMQHKRVAWTDAARIAA
jgi:hypothetical protein